MRRLAGGTRPDLSPSTWPHLNGAIVVPGDDGIVVPDDARELTGDRELVLA